VDPFAVIMLGGVAAVVVVLYLIGRLQPDAPHRSAEGGERRVLAELEDLDQMLAAANARRRARGEAELTLAEVTAEVERGAGRR
jgi:hypothetical protein